jgi:glycosyltransferase involved in cell wall biosynthesis
LEPIIVPDISVIIPTFNRAELLRKAISSVLAQEDVDIDVVVSDNCSTDHTTDVVADFRGDARIRYFRNERNLGMVENWKRALFERARTDWFVLMSDDDHLVEPTYLSRVAKAIRDHQPTFVYAGGYVNDVASGASRLLKLPFDGLVAGDKVFASRGTVSPQDAILCNMAFRRSDASRLGFLEEPDNLSCDSELYLKLCAEGSVYAIPEPVCVYLKHGANLVDRIRTSRRLLDRNLDHLVNPYAHAQRRGMPAISAAAFRVHSRLDHAIESTLLRLRLHDEQWYVECRDRLVRTAPEVVSEVECSAAYRAKWALLRAGRHYFKHRFPLDDCGAAA